MKHVPTRSGQVAKANVRVNRTRHRGLFVLAASLLALLAVPFKRAGDAPRPKSGGKPVPKPEVTPAHCSNVVKSDDPDEYVVTGLPPAPDQIGRASCRERVFSTV
jgi:hypothetical protein